MKVSGAELTYWTQTGGKRASIQIQRYQGIQGDSDFIATGKRPQCPTCKRRKMKPLLEVEQLGFFASAFNLVMKCQRVDCGQIAVYNYELEYDKQGEDGTNGDE